MSGREPGREPGEITLQVGEGCQVAGHDLDLLIGQSGRGRRTGRNHQFLCLAVGQRAAGASAPEETALLIECPVLQGIGAERAVRSALKPDRSVALLYDVGQLVGQQPLAGGCVWPISRRAEVDVISHGECLG